MIHTIMSCDWIEWLHTGHESFAWAYMEGWYLHVLILLQSGAGYGVGVMLPSVLVARGIRGYDSGALGVLLRELLPVW